MKNDIETRIIKIETTISILSEQLLILNDALTDFEIKLELQSIQKVENENII
jgi:uncharacterized coiled-coil protein SlyX